jgi:tRNA isopentenyl-2-thiomethyl-A-37 hydroxylase MiaE
MTEADFRARLAALAIHLDDRAFTAAYNGAQKLRSEAARLEAYFVRPK